VTDPRVAFEEWAFERGMCADEWPAAWRIWQAAIKHEREACARVAETVSLESFCSVPSMAMLAKNRADVAAAIRARSET